MFVNSGDRQPSNTNGPLFSVLRRLSRRFDELAGAESLTSSLSTARLRADEGGGSSTFTASTEDCSSVSKANHLNLKRSRSRELKFTGTLRVSAAVSKLRE